MKTAQALTRLTFCPAGVSLVLLATLVATSLTSNVAEAATQCKGSYSHSSGNVADRFFYDTNCGLNYFGTANAMNIRPVRSDGDRVCYTLIPPPPGYVVTSVFYDSMCGSNWRGVANTGTMYPVRSNMNVCLWGPRLPDGYKVNRTYYDSRCGSNINGFANTANIVSTSTSTPAPASPPTTTPPTTTPPPSSAPPASRPPSVAPPLQPRGIQLTDSTSWYQIQTASTYREVYQGNGGKFVPLAAGTYNVINLTSGQRTKGVVVR